MDSRRPPGRPPPKNVRSLTDLGSDDDDDAPTQLFSGKDIFDAFEALDSLEKPKTHPPPAAFPQPQPRGPLGQTRAGIGPPAQRPSVPPPSAPKRGPVSSQQAPRGSVPPPRAPTPAPRSVTPAPTTARGVPAQIAARPSPASSTRGAAPASTRGAAPASTRGAPAPIARPATAPVGRAPAPLPSQTRGQAPAQRPQTAAMTRPSAGQAQPQTHAQARPAPVIQQQRHLSPPRAPMGSVPIAVNPSTRPPAPTYGDGGERTMIMHNAPSRMPPRAAGSIPPQPGMMRPSARPAAGMPYGQSVAPAPMMQRMSTHPPPEMRPQPMMMSPTPPPVAHMTPAPGAVAYSQTPPPAHVTGAHAAMQGSGAHPAMHAGSIHPALQTGPHGSMHPSMAPGVSGAQPRISARPPALAPETYIRTRKTSPAADMVMWVVLVGGLLAGPAAAAFLCTLN